MSASEFSKTARQQILLKLRDQLQQNAARVKGFASSKGVKISTSGVSEAKRTGGIRLLTDYAQDGVVTKNGFEALATRFQEAINDKSILVTVPRIIEEKGGGRAAGGEGIRGQLEKLVSQYVYVVAEKARLIDFLSTNSIEPFEKKYGLKMKSLNEADLTTRKTYLQLFNEEFNRAIDVLVTKTNSILTRPTIYKDFVEYLESQNIKGGLTSLVKNGEQAGVVFRETHRAVNRYFKDFLLTKLKVEKHVAEFIDLNVDAGHLLGMFSQQLAFSTGGKVGIGTKGPKDLVPSFTLEVFSPSEVEKQDAQGQIELQKINKLFSGLMELTGNADVITSNLLKDLEIFLTASKNVTDQQGFLAYISAIEMQLGKDNRFGGSILGTISARMTNLISIAEKYNLGDAAKEEEAAKELAEIFNATKRIAEHIGNIAKDIVKSDFYNGVQKEVIEFLKKNSEQIASSLVASGGSDPFKVALKKKTISILDPTKPYNAASSTKINATAKAKTTTGSNKNLSKPKTVVTKPKTPTGSGKFKVSAKKLTAVRKEQPSLLNLSSILSKINANLYERIKYNMGKGERRDVLNFRTGRFAESVKVERVSESRQGMITAFYSYMKNPYATFSRGGLQELPRTRDPKTLISKSIREIASPMVANRMRAVLV